MYYVYFYHRIIIYFNLNAFVDICRLLLVPSGSTNPPVRQSPPSPAYCFQQFRILFSLRSPFPFSFFFCMFALFSSIRCRSLPHCRCRPYLFGFISGPAANAIYRTSSATRKKIFGMRFRCFSFLVRIIVSFCLISLDTLSALNQRVVRRRRQLLQHIKRRHISSSLRKT